jgi:hypothetical protein
VVSVFLKDDTPVGLVMALLHHWAFANGRRGIPIRMIHPFVSVVSLSLEAGAVVAVGAFESDEPWMRPASEASIETTLGHRAKAMHANAMGRMMRETRDIDFMWLEVMVERA